ncbi:hypothetical protein PIB30_108944, partial [Stylosanthes scabra]|nr:hypothetical protein [Stylosanthes scabra]
MITPQIQVSNSYSTPTSLIFHGTSSSVYPSFRVRSNRPISFPNHRRRRSNRYGCGNNRINSKTIIKAVAVTTEEEDKKLKVKATIRVQPTVGGLFSEMAIERGLDDIADLFGKSLLLELVSSTLDQ